MVILHLEKGQGDREALRAMERACAKSLGWEGVSYVSEVKADF